MTEDNNVEKLDVEFDQRIVKLMNFMGYEDFSKIQQIKMQRQFDLHVGEYVREQVVLGFTRIVGHAKDVVIEDEVLKILPKFYNMEGYYEEKEEFDKENLITSIEKQKSKEHIFEPDEEEQ